MLRTYGRMRRGSVALMGVLYRTGYYSKDVIRERAYGSYAVEGHRGHRLGRRGAFCTGFYSRRLRHRTFRGESMGYRKEYEKVHEAGDRMRVLMTRLGVGSIFVGWRRKDRRIGRGTSYWGNAIYVQPDGESMTESEFRATERKRRPVAVGRRGGGSARLRYESRGKELYGVKRQRKEVYKFRNKKWYFDKIYNERRNARRRQMGYGTTYKRRDRGRRERRGLSGRTSRRYKSGKEVVSYQTGAINHYTGRMMSGRRGRRRRRRRGRVGPEAQRKEEGRRRRRRRRYKGRSGRK